MTVREDDGGTAPAQFLARSGNRLVGYCGVDLGRDAEICGMVHPEYRRLGVGGTLLQAALESGAALGCDSALVICEDAAPAAIEWLRVLGATLESTELRMVLDLGADFARPPAVPALDLRPATEADRGALVALLSQGFDGMTPTLVDEMLGRLDPSAEDTFVGTLADELVATLRIYRTPTRSMVYGLVVDESRRRQGHGRGAMLAALDLLARRGEREVSLEVLPDNRPAVTLYETLGFRTSTTYRYLRLGTAR